MTQKAIDNCYLCHKYATIALQTACNALGIYFYTLHVKRFTGAYSPIIAHTAIYALYCALLPYPTALYMPTKQRLHIPSPANSDLGTKKGAAKTAPKNLILHGILYPCL